MKEIRIKNAAVLTEVFGEGEKVTGVLLEYSGEIDGKSIDTDSYCVRGKQIIGISVSREPPAPGSEKAEASPDGIGRFVHLTLEHDGPESLTVYEEPRTSDRPGGQADICIPSLEILQKKPVCLPDGREIFNKEGFISNQIHEAIVDKFRAFRYELPDDPKKRGIDYNLYIPEGYDPGKKYPLLLFIEDAGMLSKNRKVTLCQGLGAVIWASDQEQKKHPAFVLAPQYHGPDSLVEDDFSCTWEVEATMRLLESILLQYSIDRKRVYATGQSMGCMTICELSVRYPDVFAGALLVGGQWNPKTMPRAKKSRFWILVSQGDEKAFPGMNAVVESLESVGVVFGKGGLDAKKSPEEIEKEVRSLAEEGRQMYYTWFMGDSVIPEGSVPSPLLHHKNTWRVAYQIEGIRDWLFAQTRE